MPKPDRGPGCSDVSMHLPVNFKQQQSSVSKDLCLKMLVKSSTITAALLLSPQKGNGDPGKGPGREPSMALRQRSSSKDCVIDFAKTPDSQ